MNKYQVVVTINLQDDDDAVAVVERGLDKQGYVAEDVSLLVRHSEDRLNGVVEAAISRLLYDEKWLADMASSTDIDQNTPTDVFRALEDYVTAHLARM